MKLSKLLKNVNVSIISHGFDPDIGSIHYDSRDVIPGGLFIAIKGERVNGEDFIEKALDRGAAAVISNSKSKHKSVVFIKDDARKTLAQISAEFYSRPSEKLCVIGVTGTNGKTTTTYIIESILSKAGYNTGVIGTIDYRYRGQIFKNNSTTPQSKDLQSIMAEMLDCGVTHVVMEVSSHGIDLHRVHCCNFDIGIFTNLTQDHLDFHKDMDSYWECKKRFFTEILPRSCKRSKAVINLNDLKGRELFDELSIPKISYGSSDNCMVKAYNISRDLSGIQGSISTPYGDFTFCSDLIGDFNIENIMTAVAGTLDVSPQAIKKGIESVKTIPGRLEKIDNSLKKNIYVDYAHTPDALENVLKTLKPLSKGRVICVFGCGGDRDKSKRPKMGTIAGKLSSIAIITSDNPRTEEPDKIIDDIIKGMSDRSSYLVKPDRKEAIDLAVQMCRPEDVVIIAGKGHEDYQIIGDRVIYFDDREVVRKALEIKKIE